MSYIGCYKDSSTRDLPHFLINNNNLLTIEMCISICQSNNYSYAGLQIG